MVALLNGVKRALWIAGVSYAVGAGSGFGDKHVIDGRIPVSVSPQRGGSQTPYEVAETIYRKIQKHSAQMGLGHQQRTRTKLSLNSSATRLLDSYAHFVLQEFSTLKPRGCSRELWKQFQLQEWKRNAYSYIFFTFGPDFLNTLSCEDILRVVRQSTLRRYPSEIAYFLQRSLSTTIWNTQGIGAERIQKPLQGGPPLAYNARLVQASSFPWSLSNVTPVHGNFMDSETWVTRLNMDAVMALDYNPIDHKTFSFQSKLIEALEHLDFTSVITVVNLLSALPLDHRRQLWNRMRDTKGFRHPLHFCVDIKGHLALPFITLLLQSGANIDHRDKAFNTPLMRAAKAGKAYVVELLLRKGARVDLVNNKGFTALHFASSKGHVETIASLLLYGADPTVTRGPRFQWESPIHTALRKKPLRLYDTVRLLQRYERPRRYQQYSPVGQVTVLPYVEIVRSKQADLLGMFLTPVILNRYMHIRPNSKSSKHILFSMLCNRFSEEHILIVLESEIQHKNADLICATTDSKARTLFWWGCKTAYTRVLHRLLDFYNEAIANKYSGFIACNPHQHDDRGYAPIEYLITHITRRVRAGSELSIIARRILKFQGIIGTTFLAQALYSEENTMRKVSTVTFASTTNAREIVFTPPSTMSLDDFSLARSTKMHSLNWKQTTPFSISIRHRRTRAQRLVMKALILSWESNMKAFATLTSLWCGILEAASRSKCSC